MSFALNLPAETVLDWKQTKAAIDWKIIFRTSPVRAFAKAGPAVAELLTLVGTAVGLLTLIAGLSLI